MNQKYNIYCDESCHLENDKLGVMVLGAVWCPQEKTKEISAYLRMIKKAHHLNENFEIKWTKVSASKVDFYKEVVKYFFDNDDLHFRTLIIPDKRLLKHEEFKQTHDNWYYKMYFNLLKAILNPNESYRIYLDVKDTHGGEKGKNLHDVLCNNMYDFSREIIERIQIVESHHVNLLQLTDLLTGTVSYANRQLTTNEGKVELVNYMQERSGYGLTRSTLLRENKVNIFRWKASEA